MSAVLFGSISTIADTSELQRAAFNEAFATHGLGWTWNRDDYAARLEQSGGRQRIADYAASVGQRVDADAIHRTKSEIFQRTLATAPIAARPGVVEMISQAKNAGVKLALVTTTSPENVTALMAAVKDEIQPSDFDVIVDATSVDTPKPDPAAYAFALQGLDEDPAACVAIEDNQGGVHAAVAAGLACVAFPNENTAQHTFTEASRVADRLDFQQLQEFVATA